MGIQDIHILQIIEKVHTILNYGWKQKNHMVILMAISIELHLLEIGLGGQMFSNMLQHEIDILMEGTWMKHTIQLMRKYNITLYTVLSVMEFGKYQPGGQEV